MVYVNPMYINPEPNSVGKMTSLHGEVIDIASYDKQYKLPWLKLLLIGSIAVPMLLGASGVHCLHCALRLLEGESETSSTFPIAL